MKIYLILILLLVSQITYADKSLSTQIHDQYSSIRALGMGNAFTAVADDYSLIFYNPAGFARKKNNEIQFTLAGAAVAPKTQDLLKDIDNASKTAGTDSQKATAIATALEKYYGESLGGRIQAGEIFWTRKNWGIALIPVDLTVNLTVDRQLGPTIDLNVIKDTTLAYGYGADINKELSWGIAAKGIERLQLNERVVTANFADDPNYLDADKIKKRASEGFAIDADVGFLYSPSWFTRKVKKMITVTRVRKKATRQVAQAVDINPNPEKSDETKPDIKPEDKSDAKIENQAVSGTVTAKEEKKSDLTINEAASGTAIKKAEPKAAEPQTETVKEVKLAEVEEEFHPLTFALVGRNLLGGRFIKKTFINKEAEEAPERIPTVMDLGSHYEFAQLGSLTLRAMVDFKNIFYPDLTLAKSFHSGLEFDYSPSTWFKTQFRVGLNQGYYTAGTTLLLGIFNIEAATYGEEVGTTQNKKESRVYAGKFGFNF